MGGGGDAPTEENNRGGEERLPWICFLSLFPPPQPANVLFLCSPRCTIQLKRKRRSLNPSEYWDGNCTLHTISSANPEYKGFLHETSPPFKLNFLFSLPSWLGENEWTLCFKLSIHWLCGRPGDQTQITEDRKRERTRGTYTRSALKGGVFQYFFSNFENRKPTQIIWPGVILRVQS